jgi:hypothetical protein
MKKNLGNILLGVIVIITVFAAFQSQRVSNQIQNDQEVRLREASCTEDTLFKTVEALNNRTQFTTQQARSNVSLQRDQFRMLVIFLDDTFSQEDRDKAFRNYVEKLRVFIDVTSKQADSSEAFPYPTRLDYADCLSDARGSDG